MATRRRRAAASPAPGRQRRSNNRTPSCFWAAAAAVVATAWFATPLASFAADIIVDSIPLSEDSAIGRAAVRHANYPLLADTRVPRVGHNLLRVLSLRHPASGIESSHEWDFRVVDDRSVNAFAYPGGSIFVTRGLLQIVTDAELRGVIGHEVGHVLHRHSQKRLVLQQLFSLLLSVICSSDGDGDGRSEPFSSEVSGLLLNQAQSFSRLSYSRENEYEADAVGQYLDVISDINPISSGGSLQSFFRKLDGGEHSTSWHSTHPGSKDRIEVLDRKQHALRKLGRHGVAWKDLVPAVVTVLGGAENGASQMGSVFGTAWRLTPDRTKLEVLREGLRAVANMMEQLWLSYLEGSSSFSDRGRMSEGTPPPRPAAEEATPPAEESVPPDW